MWEKGGNKAEILSYTRIRLHAFYYEGGGTCIIIMPDYRAAPNFFILRFQGFSWYL